MPTALHRRPSVLLAVLAGGLLGTLARYGLALALPADGWPLGTFSANLLGAFALGVLLERLAGDGSDRGGLLRLVLGTGFLGAFTTYSALAVETDLLVRDGRPLLAAGYALSTVVAGVLLSTLGAVVAARRRPRP